MEGSETWMPITSVPDDHILTKDQLTQPAPVDNTLRDAAATGIVATGSCAILVILAILAFILVCAKIVLS